MNITHVTLSALILGNVSHTMLYAHKPEFNAQHFNTTHQQSIHAPSSLASLKALVQKAHHENRKISLVGAGKSQGGQTVSSHANSVQISLKRLNKLLNLNVEKKQVTVQTGMTWAQLQRHIAPHRLAVKAMQSYNDFSIGGSLGVNVHGQDLVDHPLIKTVVEFKLMQADGTIISASRTENPDLFSAAIGGYGLLGIIVEVTLELTDDILLDKTSLVVDTKNFFDIYTTHLENQKPAIFGAIRLNLNKNSMFQKGLVISWNTSNKRDESLFKLCTAQHQSTWRKWLIKLMSRSTYFKNCRFWLETQFNKFSETISRNNFMGTAIACQLPEDTPTHCYILQEYFIPYHKTTEFLTYLAELIEQHNINILNVTARHSSKNTESLLTFTPETSCAFVLYIEVERTQKAYATTADWSEKLIDKALDLSGTYYLPYHLFATSQQFNKAYPRWQEFLAVKSKYDPQEIFTNSLYEKYRY